MAFVPKFEKAEESIIKNIKVELVYETNKENVTVSANKGNIEKKIREYVTQFHPEDRKRPITFVTCQSFGKP